MNVIYARQPLPKSIFLVGPTPREKTVLSWRPEALRLIKVSGFDGNIYVPEDSEWSPKFTYDDQVEWEWEALMISTVVMVWIPRELATMPAFTTNVEYGYTIKDLNLVIGWPEDAPKNYYLEKLAIRHHLPIYHTLEDTVHAAVMMAERPFAPK